MRLELSFVLPLLLPLLPGQPGTRVVAPMPPTPSYTLSFVLPLLLPLLQGQPGTRVVAPMPPAPGYTFVASAVIGDSLQDCPVTGNLDPPDQLTQLEPTPCAGESCFAAAQKACDADAECLSFALAADGGDPSKVVRAQLFRAGLGNAIPGGAWQLYAKSKPCDTCPGGEYEPATQLPKAEPAWMERHQCKTSGNGYPCGHCASGGTPPCPGGAQPGVGVKGCEPCLQTLPVYCNPTSSWGVGLVVSLSVSGVLYVGVGLWLGKQRGLQQTAESLPRAGRAAGLLRSHPHWNHWLELRALVEDGAAYARAGSQRANPPRNLARRNATDSQQQRSSAVAGVDSDGSPRQKQQQQQRREKQQQEHRSSGEKKEKENRRGKKEQRARKAGKAGKEPLLPEPAAPALPPTAAATADSEAAAGGGPKVTASGGGGKWVHIPN
jgi:hypothetical protein